MTAPIDSDAELNWTAPTLAGTYVIRYTATGNEGTFSDDITVTVTDVPTGPQTATPDSIPSQARVGEPTVTVAPPEGVELTYVGPGTYLGPTTYLGYGPAAPQTLTVVPTSIPSRLIVGQPTVTVKPVPVPIVVVPDSIGSRLRIGAPSVTLGSAPPDQPVTDLSLSLFAIDRVTGAGTPLPDFASLTLSPLRNSGGAVTIEYPDIGENFQLLRDAITNGRDVEIEIWTSGTARGALRGYLQEARGDDIAEDGLWTFAGGFLGLRMDEAVIEPQDLGPLVPDDDEDPDNDQHANEKRELIFNAATAGTVMATAVTQAHARDVLTDIIWDFTATHDSDGVAWPQVMTSRFSPGATYRQILDRLVTLGLAEWDVVWSGAHRVLRMWVPEGRGEDRTDDPVPVVLRHGQNILDAPRKWSVREAGTTVWVAGSDGLYDEASDATALTRRGRRIERFVSANNLADAEAVTAYAINRLPLITAGLHEVTHGIGFQAGAPRPIVSYDVGDWVYSESGDELERLRVVQWTLTADADQQMSGTVTLNDTHTDALVRLQARLDAITAGETVVGTSDPGTNLSDITPPAAPEGLVVSSIAYQDPAHTQTLASVTVGWLPVVTNADGSNYPEVQAARHILLQMEDLENRPPNPDDPDDDRMIDQNTWTWTECPRVVTDYAPALRAAWVADGSPAGVETWLQSYVDEFSATPTATDDVAGYQVRYAYIGLDQVGGLPSSDPFPDDTRFYYEATPSNGITGTSYTFGGVEGGANVRIEVRAFDRASNFGPWATIGHDTAMDDTPPPQPSAPGVVASFRGVHIGWNGLGSLGEGMPVDFDHVEVWIGQGADMTLPTTSTPAQAFDPLDVNPQCVAWLYASGTHSVQDMLYDVGYYAALRAVDRAGNPSGRSDVAGPSAAEKLFSDDLRDQIINDPTMIAAQTIGTLHVVDGAIINAKIGDLAVNNAKVADLDVGKLRTGTMTAHVTISGKFRTHPSDAANRVEFDAAGIRLYQGATVIGEWRVADASMLVTGTWRTGLSGERAEGNPDGSVRFYPPSGANYSQLSNLGSDLVMRGPVNTDGRSGRVNVNVLGVGMNYSAESEIPDRLRSEVALFDRRTRMTATFQALEVDGRYANPAGGIPRIQFSQLSSSGTTMPYSYLSYSAASSSGRGGMWGNGAGWKLEAGQMLVTGDELSGFGVIKASEFATPSSRKVKRDIVDMAEVLDPEQAIRDSPAVRFNYRDDEPQTHPRFGVIAEEMPEALQRLGPDGKGGLVLSVDLNSQLGLHHAAIRKIITRLDEMERGLSEPARRLRN